MIKIKSIAELKKLAQKRGFECVVLLNGGLGSRKTVSYNPVTKMWRVRNHIDDSRQVLTTRQLNTKSYTHVGEAIKKNALIYRT